MFLVDDLVTKGTSEPYRMFTSRAEYRLILRQDNADLRLMDKGYQFGLIPKEQYKNSSKKELIEQEIKRLQETRIKPTNEIQELFKTLTGTNLNESISLAQLLKRSEIDYASLKKLCSDGFIDLPAEVIAQVEIHIKYEGYIKRQLEQVEQFKKLENIKIPADFDYKKCYGLSTESSEKLTKIKPASIGQASRISGVSPADTTVLLINLKKL